MIHPQAIVDPKANIAPGVSIGAFSIIGADVIIEEGTWVGPHVVINGPTTIGKNNKIYQFASIGEAPQDKKYAGEPTRLEIGDNNIIRESVTISRGTAQDSGVTRLGNDNLIMAYAHIAHDCQVGNSTVFANSTSLAGHVHVADYVIFGGFTLVHQFCKIGAYCFTAMGSAISKDVPPYLRVAGHMAKPYGLNSEGLKRRGFSPDAIAQLRDAYKILYRSSLTLEQATQRLSEKAEASKEIKYFLDFIKASGRGIIR
ncbi:MAG: acyl-ACP--UDP-N-acetylglucosamine O-acyltransferase [Gammaproteobacteria bacterium]|nr:acyl-ACP--UDP-N-acetylglucosamine O-acyltransferase [Gammaproteobacteria bacterium]